MAKMNALLFFVDNNGEEINNLWNSSFVSTDHTMVPFEPFVSLEQTIALIEKTKPTIILLGYYLDGVTTGVDVMEKLKELQYPAVFISNTGDDGNKLFPKVKRHANRHPYELYAAIDGTKTDNSFAYLGYQKNIEDFENAIQGENYLEAKSMLRRIKDYHRVEHYVHIALRTEYNLIKKAPNLIDYVLEYFLDQREDICPAHGYWVHSASHFDKRLWELELKKWLSKFITVAITGANELSNTNCSGRLIAGFFLYSNFNDDPKDFGITAESIRFNGKLSEYEQARIEAGTFPNETEYLAFQLHFADAPILTTWSNEYQLTLLDATLIKEAIERFEDSRPEGFIDEGQITRALYQKQFGSLNKQLRDETHPATIEKLEKALAMTRTFF